MVALLGAGGWAFREPIRFWWQFEPLGTHEQGRPEFRHRPRGRVFVQVSGGTFTMGSPLDEEGRGEHEGPQHEVTWSPFLIAKHEVTLGVYADVMGENSSYSGDGEDHPVENVSWHDAQERVRSVRGSRRHRGVGGDREAHRGHALSRGRVP